MAKTISCQQLNEWIDNDEQFTLIDVLEPKQFETFHLPGAINAPFSKNFQSVIKQNVPSTSESIVVYSKDKTCKQATEAVTKLNEWGYTNVQILSEGKTGWQQAGLPTTTGVAAAA